MPLVSSANSLLNARYEQNHHSGSGFAYNDLLDRVVKFLYLDNMNRALSQQPEEEVSNHFHKLAPCFVGIHAAILMHEPPVVY